MMQHLVPLYEPQLALPSNQKRVPDDKPRSGEPAEPVDHGVKILIVEDDYLIGMQAEIALLDAGFDIIGVAVDADEALAIARQHKPTLAVMDIRLGGQRDGVDAAADLFAELGVRCVFATAHDDQHVRARAAPFEPLGWLTKPYTMASLVNLVREAASRPRP